MSSPILFNRCGSAVQLNNSITGPGFAITGTPVYITGQFGNAMYVTGTDYARITINSIMANNDRGAIECWCKKETTFSVAGTYFGFENLITGDWVVRTVSISANVTQLAIGVAGVTSYLDFRLDTSGLSAGEWFHAAICWDRSGIDGGANTGRAYVNGSLMASTNTAISQVVFGAGYGMRLGNNPVGAAPLGTERGTDNFKIYGFAKTNYNDRFDERGGMNDFAMVA